MPKSPLELVNRCDLTVERKHNYLLRSLYFNFLTAYRSWRFRILFFVRSTRTRSFSGLKDTDSLPFFVPLSFCSFLVVRLCVSRSCMYACLLVFVLSNGWNKGLWGLDGISQESVLFLFSFACNGFYSRGRL